MKQLYLLPCICGLKIQVDTTQAGLTVRCECGRMVEAPTMRDLVRLEKANDRAQAGAKGAAGVWGPRQGITLVGVLVALIGLVWLGYQIATMPEDLYVEPADIRAEVETLSPAQLMEQFTLLRERLDPTELPIVRATRLYQEWHRRWTWVAAAVTLAGVVVAGGAWLTLGGPPKRQGKPIR